MNTTASNAEAALQILMYNEKKKACTLEKYVSQHIMYHIILENLKNMGMGTKALIKHQKFTICSKH